MEGARLQPRAAPSAGAPTLPPLRMSFPGQRNERARSALAVTISEEPDIAVAAISEIIKPAIVAFLHGTFRRGSSRLCCDARGGGRTRWCSHAPLIPMPRCALHADTARLCLAGQGADSGKAHRACHRQ